MNWCSTPGGKRCSASAADVTVPEVTRTAKFCARMRSISGTTASISPTLARVHPDQRTVRTRLRRLTAALRKPGRVLLAALEPPRQ